jgi:hypothetical protein
LASPEEWQAIADVEGRRKRKKENILDTQLLQEVGYLAKIANLKSVNSSKAAAPFQRSALWQFRPMSLNPASLPNQQRNLYH